MRPLKTISAKIHYAPLYLGNKDIPVFEFKKRNDLLNWLDDLKSASKLVKRVYLLSCDDNAEIIITENLSYIIRIFDQANQNNLYPINLWSKKNIYLQEYQSFESAYAVALDMQESVSDICYDETYNGLN